MKKATFDNFNAYVQREYDYLYNCIDIMRKTASHEEDSERLKSDIEETVVIQKTQFRRRRRVMSYKLTVQI